MPWTELDLGTAELALKDDGSMEWNAALQQKMGDPAWVEIMWDATQRWLGIRAVNAATGVPIEKEPKTGEYSIDSAAILTAAAISVDETVSDEPQKYLRTVAEGITDPLFGTNAIYYITVPE
jgi:hypothetical protein